MLITPAKALEIILSAVRPLPAARVPLEQAAGAYLARAVRCDRGQPPRDRSAMDGYAVVVADLAACPVKLPLAGEVAAGSDAKVRVRRGLCAAILTGGNVPPGADAVVPVEQTRRKGDVVLFHAAVGQGDNIRRRGEEARRGQVLLEAGTRLGPAEIGVCAMAGAARPAVRRRPVVAVLCTGAEVADAACRVRPHQLRDSNGPTLLAALEQFGFPHAGRSIVRDDPKAIAAAIATAWKRADVVLVTGGVSVGDYDFVPQAVAAAGGRIRFHGVNMKPGQPQLYATRPGNKHLFGLPGNPVSMLTGFHELALPALRALAGAPREACRPALTLTLAQPARSKGRRAYFALASLVPSAAGLQAAPIRSAGSADLVAAARADGVIVIPAGVTALSAGDPVEYHAWRPVP